MSLCAFPGTIPRPVATVSSPERVRAVTAERPLWPRQRPNARFGESNRAVRERRRRRARREASKAPKADACKALQIVAREAPAPRPQGPLGEPPVGMAVRVQGAHQRFHGHDGGVVPDPASSDVTIDVRRVSTWLQRKGRLR